MYDTKTSWLLIISLTSSTLTAIYIAQKLILYFRGRYKEMTLAQASQMTTHRKGTATLILSMRKQIISLLRRVENLEAQRDKLELENEKCAKEVMELKQQINTKQ